MSSNYNVDHEEVIRVGSNAVEAKSDSISTSRHKRIREDAEEVYRHTANVQLTKYISRCCKRQRVYVVGDIIGLKVSDVDRTNTSSTILPCKIISSTGQNADSLYNVATMNGIIQQGFQSATFLDLTSSNFASLRNLNTDTLPSISFIQACQLYTKFKSADTCKCNGNCNTNRCYCKKKGRKCCSKCHGGNQVKCENY